MLQKHTTSSSTVTCRIRDENQRPSHPQRKNIYIYIWTTSTPGKTTAKIAMKLFPILLSLFILQTSAQRDTGLTVNTQQGPVIGTLATPTVRRFLGIPFATAKRWQAPRLPPVRRAAFIANKFGNSCFQDLNPPNVEYLKLSNTQGINVSESEDCMSINIWTPSIERKQKTAVMVWIYGGAFTFGTSNVPMFDGQNIVRDNDDLTLVTFNYRLNIFGQPNAPQLGSNNLNFGLLDVEAAVNWVHANIAEFGGDPERIVIFGQSAGAAAADAYAFAHPRDTIVKAWNTVAEAVGCGSTPTSQQFSCMQVMPAKKLEAAVISTNAAFTLVADNVNTRAANGNFLHVPLMGGTTMNENDIFAVAGELVTTGFAKPVITEMISDIQTLGQTCAAGAAAVFRINVNVPTWRYQYQAIFPGVSTRQDLRAFHSSEIQMVFGTFNISSPNPSSTQIALSRYVQSAWVAFARNPTQGLIDFGWPLYNPNTTSLAQLGGITNQTGVAFAKGSDIDAPRTTTKMLSGDLWQESSPTNNDWEDINSSTDDDEHTLTGFGDIEMPEKDFVPRPVATFKKPRREAKGPVSRDKEYSLASPKRLNTRKSRPSLESTFEFYKMEGSPSNSKSGSRLLESGAYQKGGELLDCDGDPKILKVSSHGVVENSDRPKTLGSATWGTVDTDENGANRTGKNPIMYQRVRRVVAAKRPSILERQWDMKEENELFVD
ncbi:hypothetical protein D9613_000964 [Agrocybe pediades]|uniref:Carboxylesterase type B domain-containing protein n=1 Tax=Agrocybe pediades TaxID=84607 RepID=A0A8H4R198_9AGAR|nr:hypothetical protein D9613_000964 [Agrocybe pediades]